MICDKEGIKDTDLSKNFKIHSNPVLKCYYQTSLFIYLWDQLSVELDLTLNSLPLLLFLFSKASGLNSGNRSSKILIFSVLAFWGELMELSELKLRLLLESDLQLQDKTSIALLLQSQNEMMTLIQTEFSAFQNPAEDYISKISMKLLKTSPIVFKKYPGKFKNSVDIIYLFTIVFHV